LFFAAAKKSRCRPAQGRRLKHANNSRMPAKAKAKAKAIRGCQHQPKPPPKKKTAHPFAKKGTPSPR
ncbi:hypothetical protein, partial [Paraburkholderia caribensis]|uniref:hypothetical protein n=1 Tax=Paraburkholderia caribensis TaxID=75105 RepID=UPI0031D04385